MFYPFIRLFVYLPGNDKKFEQLISVCFEDESEDGPKARQLRRFHLNLSLCTPYLQVTRCQYLLIWPAHINTILCDDQKLKEETWPFSLSFRFIVIVFSAAQSVEFLCFAHPTKTSKLQVLPAACRLVTSKSNAPSACLVVWNWPQLTDFLLQSVQFFCILFTAGQRLLLQLRAKTRPARSGQDQTETRPLSSRIASACNFHNGSILLPFCFLR